MDDLASILNQAEQLTNRIDGIGATLELPRVDRNLKQICEETQQLLKAGGQPAGLGQQDVNASILLGAKGVDVPRLSQKLESLSATANLEPLEPIQETDIQSFLKNERENAILAILEETRKETYNHFNKICWNSIQSDWEKNKQKIIDSLGGARESILDLTAPSGERLNEIWKMIEVMSEVPLVTSSSPVLARSSIPVQNSLVRSARKILENRYLEYLKKEVYRNLSSARLGGSIGTFHLVKSFLGTRQVSRQPGLEDGLVDGQPVWAIVYYCLRCGDLEAALDAAKRAGPSLSEFSRNLEEVLASNDCRLTPNNEAQVKLNYRRTVRNATDPYRRACYCIIASCDPSEDHSEIASTTEDYLWIKICQLRADGEEEMGASREIRFTLSYFQSLILEEYGERHFDAYKEPLRYFEVLFLTSQFEAAVEFLSRIDKWRTLAIHVALALRETKLLLLPESVQSPLISKVPTDKPPMRRLNLARLVMLYTKKFENTNIKEALNYYFFLRDLETPDGTNLFTVCISELAVETRQYEQLLGKIEADGCRSPGIIDRYQGVDISVQEVIQHIAEIAETSGQFEDAVAIYDLAKKDDKVIEILIRLLASNVSRPATTDAKIVGLQRHAHNIAERLRSARRPVPSHLSSTFYLLLDLATFFGLYHSGRVNEALDTIAQLRLIPLNQEEVDSRVSMFKNLAEEIRRNIPDVVLATMNLLLNKYKQQRSVPSPSLRKTEEITRDKFLSTTRAQARCLITFTGMIPYRMPSDITSRLVQMELQMN
ncbi:hypothetical protein QYM36_014191 [Artemia franciscana]|uniref:Nuclear pore protein n=1 Tax=Artemia franciscana TaxID=6661 RepID=A0AA88L5B7_ARTSF|nr:hypothetical protein QYM36_014191 [Artemia franciscana]